MTAIRLVQTGAACPETYDAMTPDGTVVGSAHLRHGTFTVTVGDTVVYGKNFGDNYSVFATGQRERYLDIATTKILEHLNAADAPEDGIRVTVTARELLDRFAWKRACSMLGLNPLAVIEGQMDTGERLTFTMEQARTLGLLKDGRS